jgi:4-diphosphocytidyl-2-C-methyl-D-erythritol kinase
MNIKSSETLTLIAPAKLNLTFEILSRRRDNYHEVATIFQAIDLFDRLHFAIKPAQEFSLELRLACRTASNEQLNIPLDSSNIIAKACQSFCGFVGETKRLSIKVLLEKNIPVKAGLAGGSADGAATLVALNRLLDANLDLIQLQEIGAALGSDVPFCLTGGCCWGQGRGELLQPITYNRGLNFVIVKPLGLSIATPWAFETFDKSPVIADRPKVGKRSCEVANLINNGQLEDAVASFGNDFESLIFEHHPLLAAVKEAILDWGVLSCHMTGSGPTLFALVENAECALALTKYLRTSKFVLKKDSNTLVKLDVWMAESINHGAIIVNGR